MQRNLQGRKILFAVWKRQKGICPEYQKTFKTSDEWQLHHIIRKVDGGTNQITNFMMLHPNCHRKLHSNRG
ncbi:MAG: HNH endonuclease [SAR324 cluster bacterium]|nr:HNH endonuclease [SAR324 cluster bacterium]